MAIALAVAGFTLLLDRLAPDVNLFDRLREGWPWALVVLGLVGLVNLLPATNAKRGPVILIVLGLGLAAATSGNVPDEIAPFIWPILLIVAAFGLLVLQLTQGQETALQAVTRWFLIGRTRRINWKARDHTLLIMHTIAGGCVLTFEGTPVSSPIRLEISASLAGVEVRVPKEWTIAVDSRRPIRWRPSPVEPALEEEPDLRVVVMWNVLSGIEVRKC